MSDLVFNSVKGQIVTYAGLPGASDAIIVVPIKSAGIVDDSIMRGYSTLAALLAASNDEETTMGRKTCTGVTITPTGNQIDVLCDDIVWTAATGDQIAALVFCYVPDTTTSSDSDIIPLSKYDFAISPTGNDITAKIPAGGFLRAT